MAQRDLDIQEEVTNMEVTATSDDVSEIVSTEGISEQSSAFCLINWRLKWGCRNSYLREEVI